MPPAVSKQLFSPFHLSVVSLFNLDEYLFNRAVILHQDLIDVHPISSFWLSPPVTKEIYHIGYDTPAH
jgi:hypothetical protein